MPDRQPQQRAVGVQQEVRHENAERDPDQEPDDHAAAPEHAERDPGVARVGDVDAEEDVDALALAERLHRKLLGGLVERHHDARGRDRPGHTRRGWTHRQPWTRLTTRLPTMNSTKMRTIGLRSSAPAPTRSGGRKRRKRLRYGSVTSGTNLRSALSTGL